MTKKSEKSKAKTKTLQIRLTVGQLGHLDELIGEGAFTSRGEAIRNIVGAELKRIKEHREAHNKEVEEIFNE